MLGNRTQSTRAIARHQAAATAQSVAASLVRTSSDAALVTEVIQEINQSLLDQQEQLQSIDQRVGDLEDIP